MSEFTQHIALSRLDHGTVVSLLKGPIQPADIQNPVYLQLLSLSRLYPCRLYVLWGFVVVMTSVTKAAKRKVSH